MNPRTRKSLEELQAAASSEHGLRRTLGPWSLTLLGIGATIGAGIFVLTGRAYTYAFVALGEPVAWLVGWNLVARDGLVPAVFARVHPKYHTPFADTVIITIAAGLIGALFPIDILGELVSIGTLLAFAIVCASVLILRRNNPRSIGRIARRGSLRYPCLALFPVFC